MAYPALGTSKEGVGSIVLCLVFEFLAIIAIFLRIWSRRLKKFDLVFNDYAAIVAIVLTTGLCIVTITAVLWAGEGRHEDEIDPTKQGRILIIFAAGQPVWGAANTAVKLSILSLYTTIFPSRHFHKVCYLMVILSIAYFIMVLLETFLLCHPVAYNWDKSIDGTCANTSLAYLLAAISNLIIDVVIVILPLPLLWRLQLQLPKKIAITGMFSLGLVICIITLLRVIFVKNLNMLDFSYSSTGLGRWSFLEPSLGVINTSLPVMRPAIQKIFGSQALRWTTKVSMQGSSEGTNEPNRRWFSITTKRIGTANGSNPKRFQPLIDRGYPLEETRVCDKRGGTVPEASRGSPAVGIRSPTQISISNGIRCTTEWNVETESK